MTATILEFKRPVKAISADYEEVLFFGILGGLLTMFALFTCLIVKMVT